MKKIIILIVLILSSYTLSAQYVLHSSVFGGGGTVTDNSTYILRGSVFQPNVGEANGGTYSMKIGFWNGYRFLAFEIPSLTTTAVSAITVSSASSGGNISDIGSSAVTASGIVYGTSTEPTIGGLGVTQVATDPLVGTGAFVSALSGLSVNTLYYIRAYATNTSGTSYGNEVTFYTLANEPSAPTLSGATATSINAVINANSNPASTEYAIRIGTDYVQDNGTLGETIHWKTKALWEVDVTNTVRTITGLTPNTEYSVDVIARNGSETETAYSSTASLYTLANVSPAPTVNAPSTSTLNVAVNTGTNPVGTQFAIEETISGDFVQTDGTLGASADWQTEAQWEVNAGNTAKTVIGLGLNTQYTFAVKARNNADPQVETVAGATASDYTLADAPAVPTLSGETATTINVAIDENSNPSTTEYAIRVGVLFVQTNGSLGGAEVWKTKALWEVDETNTVKTVTGLTPNTEYTVDVKARNEDDVETAYSNTAALITLATVPSAPTVNGATTTTLNVAVNTGTNPVGTEFAIQETTSGDFVQADGSLNTDPVWQTEAEWEINAGNTAITVTGFDINTEYTFAVLARNDDFDETTAGASTSLFTLANDPGTPTVDNPSPTTLDVTIDVNSNPADTEFAIQETGGNYVQANGSLAGGVVWQNAATWNSPVTVTGLTSATEYTFKAIARNGNNVTTAFGGTASLFTLSTEPTNHATNLNYVSPTTISSIILTWVDAVGGTLPDSYIIKASTVSAEAIVAPVDATAEVDGLFVKNVAYGAETVEFTGLNSGTTYYFKIYPYNGENTTVNYKTDGVVPMVACSTLVAYPTEQATNITFSSITRTSMTVKWTRGNGDGSVLLGKEKYRIPASLLTDGNIYENASPVYTIAPSVSGTKVLYWGPSASPSVNVTGLTRYQLIYFKVCEFNDIEDPKYLQIENATNPGSRWTLRRDGLMEEDLTLDAEYAYPNPATNSISTTLDVYEEGTVSAALYDIEGKKVIELYNQTLPFGSYNLIFDVSGVSSGVYQLIMTKGSEAIAYPVAVVR